VQTVHRLRLRSGVPSGKSERIRVQRTLPGRARGDPADRCDNRAEESRRHPHQRSDEALLAHLEPLRGLADVEGKGRQRDARRDRRQGRVAPARRDARLSGVERRLAARPQGGELRSGPRRGDASRREDGARTEIHAPARTLLRGQPDQGPRGRRRRPSLDVRIHRGDALRQRVRRAQRRAPPSALRARENGGLLP